MSASVPERPPTEWFARGIIERRKLDGFLLSPTHPVGRHKLRLWRAHFGIGVGDAEPLERLIREQLRQARPEPRQERHDSEDPSKIYRRWELVIPRFRSLDGREGPVLTAWALDPDRDRPHLSSAYPLPG